LTTTSDGASGSIAGVPVQQDDKSRALTRRAELLWTHPP
jgi:hypothetical protein